MISMEVHVLLAASMAVDAFVTNVDGCTVSDRVRLNALLPHRLHGRKGAFQFDASLAS